MISKRALLLHALVAGLMATPSSAESLLMIPKRNLMKLFQSLTIDEDVRGGLTNLEEEEEEAECELDDMDRYAGKGDDAEDKRCEFVRKYCSGEEAETLFNFVDVYYCGFQNTFGPSWKMPLFIVIGVSNGYLNDVIIGCYLLYLHVPPWVDCR